MTVPDGDNEQSLRELQQELGEAAQADYDADPVRAVLGRLFDALGEHEWHAGEEADYTKGYRMAIYDVCVEYINYSGEFTCDCELGHPAPVKTNAGEWYCDECGAFLSPDLRDVIKGQKDETDT